MAQIPMTAAEFLAVFRAYNDAVWPAPVVLALLAVLAAWRATQARGSRDRVVAAIVAGLWAWAGIVYLIAFLAPQNPAAYMFGALFVLQTGILLRAGMRENGLRFEVRRDLEGVAGMVVIAFALIVYPILGFALGHGYPEMPTFGAPCPTTIFTFGVLLWTAGRVPWYVLAIPVAWSFTAVSAAVRWGVLEDLAMPVVAVLGCALLVRRSRALKRAVHIPRAAAADFDSLSRSSR